MRRLLTLMITFAVLVPAAACGSEPDPRPGPDDTPTPPTAASSATGEPAPTATTTPAAPPPPSSGELPGGLPFGDRTLTGVVEHSGDCTMLRVGTRLWGLTGTPAGALSAGDRVTVEGQVTTADSGCETAGVTRMLVVRRAMPA